MAFNPSLLDENLQYQARFEYSTGQVLYAGYAPATAAESDPMWVIKKYVYSGTDVVKIVFADDSSNFNKIWSNRTSYTYK